MRERIWPGGDYGGYATDSYTGKKTAFIVKSPGGREVLGASQGHQYPYHEGGTFLVQKGLCVTTPTTIARERWATISWEGNHIPNPMPSPYDLLQVPSIPDTTMVSMGTKGWDRLKPGRTSADVGQMIGELKDFGQMFKPVFSWKPGKEGFLNKSPSQQLAAIKKAASDGRGVGNAYLAYEFGWNSFARDLDTLLESTMKLQSALKQLRRDNGKLVRRRGTISGGSVHSIVDQTGYGLFQPTVGPYWADSGKAKATTITETINRFWFSGAFRYFIPDLPDSPVDLGNLRRLLGLTPTPKLAWELTPWSWLADYFGNVGSVLSNVSGNAADSLVAVYAYVMGTEGNIVTRKVQFRGMSGRTYKCQYVMTRICKRRLGATPYGFGVDLSGISPKQAAILAALGLSRF